MSPASADTAYQAAYGRRCDPHVEPETGGAVLGRRAGDDEVIWSASHGMAVLSAGGLVPVAGQEERLVFLITRIADTPGGPTTP